MLTTDSTLRYLLGTEWLKLVWVPHLGTAPAE